MTAYDALNRLQAEEPGVFLNEEHAWRGTLVINPIALRDGDECIVADRLVDVLSAVRAPVEAEAGRR
jgi:hypothetical protein